MRVMITGANGQVGDALVRQGASRADEIIPVTRTECDFSQPETFAVLFDRYQPELVINAAAYTAVDAAEDDADPAQMVNAQAPTELARLCAKQKIPLLHISTDYVFDGEKEGLYQEHDPVKPLGVYGATKLSGEQCVRDQLENHIILRTSWVFSRLEKNFVSTMLRLMGEREALSIVGDQFGGPTAAEDIAATLWQIVDAYKSGQAMPWGTYHYSGAPYVSWYEFAVAIQQAALEQGMLDKPIPLSVITTEQYPTRAQRPANSRLDCSKINQAFGIEQPDWILALNKVLETWRVEHDH